MRGSGEADRPVTSWTTGVRRGGRSIPGPTRRAPNSQLTVIPGLKAMATQIVSPRGGPTLPNRARRGRSGRTRKRAVRGEH